jgi:hypothetical protein
MSTPRDPSFEGPKAGYTDAGAMLRAGGAQTSGPDCMAIQGLLEKLSDATDADRTSRTPHTKQAIHAIENELRIARATATSTFADQHGWERAKKGFPLHQLRNGHRRPRWTDDLWPNDWTAYPIDHAEYYCFAWGPRFPAAIVSHEYSSFEESEALAKANGLIATRLPASWYNPARATAVVYTSPLIPFPADR